MEVPCLRAVTPVEKDSKQGTSACRHGLCPWGPFKRNFIHPIANPFFLCYKK